MAERPDLRLPWRVHSFGEEAKGYCHAIERADGSFVAFNLDKKLADLIVDAVNSGIMAVQPKPELVGTCVNGFMISA